VFSLPGYPQVEVQKPKIREMKIAVDGNENNVLTLPCTKEEFRAKVGKKLIGFRVVQVGYILSLDDDKWHLSISLPNRLPVYAELKFARYKYLPDDVYMAQIFPPEAEFVNMHPNTLHLFEIDQKPVINNHPKDDMN